MKYQFRHRMFALFMAVSFVLLLTLAGEQQRNCLMKPARFTMQIPRQGFIWLSDEEFTGQCDTVSNDNWKVFSSANFDLLIYPDGPTGSGRYWTISIALKSKVKTEPLRGFCFTTSTVGWRTLPESAKFPLKWVEDRDGDGKPELIIWDSFTLREEATMAEYGLIGWVYQVNQRGLCRIDWNLSRKLAGEIAAAYQQSTTNDNPISRNLCLAAAEALQSFSTNQCNPPIP
jgi:hypothetical protein